MKILLQLTFILLLFNTVYCQQFIEGVKIKEYYPDKSNSFIHILGHANNSVLLKAGYTVTSSTSINGFNIPYFTNYPSLFLTGGTSNYDFLIKKDIDVSKDNLLYTSPYVYFGAANVIYKTNLNTGTTAILKESAGNFCYPVKAGGNIFYWKYVDDEGKINKILCKTDGTTIGTGLVKDLNGNKNSFISRMVAHNTDVYFLENDSTGCRLWRSNGTSGGTVVVAEVYCNFNNSVKQNPVLMNGSIYFVVDYANKETYLWKYNIASNTKVAVKLINNQEQRLDIWKPITTENRYPVSRYGFTVWGNSLYFRGNISGQTGLWKSDGTNAGTVLIKEMAGELDEFAIANNKLYFVRSLYQWHYNYSTHGTSTNPAILRQLWFTDGTAAGTNILRDFSIYTTCDPNPRMLLNCNNQLLFFVNDSAGRYRNDTWLIGSNGTPAGTKKLLRNMISSLSYNKDLNALFYTYKSNLFTNATLYKGIICNNANIPANKYTVTQNANEDNSFNKPGTCDSLITMVQPGYSNTNNLSTTATVWIENKQPANFVKRHYQITPTIGYNGECGGRVTLYFKQSEFDDYNVKHTPALPSSSIISRNTDIKSIRIAWYPGTSSDQTGLPASYQVNATIIDPDDNDIIWNSTMNCWEISFNCTSFGGFFLQTQTTP
jgi:ELWxxDGT repeat protein